MVMLVYLCNLVSDVLGGPRGETRGGHKFGSRWSGRRFRLWWSNAPPVIPLLPFSCPLRPGRSASAASPEVRW